MEDDAELFLSVTLAKNNRKTNRKRMQNKKGRTLVIFFRM
jgi:hypothetical protein